MKILRSSFIVIVLLIIASPCFAKVTGSILFVRDGDLWKYSCKSKKEVLYIKKATKPACSKDGKRLAFVRDGNIWTSDITGENQKEITAFKTDNELDSLEWFPSGDKILFSREEEYQISYTGEDRKLNWPPGEVEAKSSKLSTRSIWILSLKDCSLIKFIGNTPGSLRDDIKLAEVDSPSWHPDPSKNLLAYTRGGDIWFSEYTDGGIDDMDKSDERVGPVASLEDHYGASPGELLADDLSWSKNGKYILYDLHRPHASGFGLVYELDPKTQKTRQITEADDECFPVYSPDEKKIALINRGAILLVKNNHRVVQKTAVAEYSHQMKLIDNVDRERFLWIKE